MIIYSIIHKGTFENVSKFIQELIRAKNSYTIPVIIVGNKIDLEDQREINSEEGKELASKHQFQFFETSAKKRTRVDDIFHEIVREIRRYRLKNPQKEQGCCIL